MAGGYPLGLELCNGQDVGTNLAGTDGTTITASGSVNTKGSWTQLIASTAGDCCFAFIDVILNVGAATNVLFDIGVGAAASEVVICSNLFAGMPAAGGGAAINSYCFPLSIPAGSRIAARCQSDVGGATVTVRMATFDGAFTQIEGASGVDMIGVSTSTSLSTVVSPSASANTKGSYAQLIASTARDYIGIVPIVQGTQIAGAFAVDISIGSAGNEVDLIPNLLERNPGGNISVGVAGVFFPIPIPAGTRVSSRCQFKNASGTDLGVAAAGVYL